MEYREIPYVKKKVSRILFGTALNPLFSGAEAHELLQSMYDAGINTFDTARNYMDAESSIGKWIEAYEMRDKIVLLSKCGHPDDDGNRRVNETEMRRDFAISTEKLRTDYIDIYLLHRDDPDVAVGTIVEIFNAMHAEGKIGAFGGSNWTVERIAAANEYAYSHNLVPFTVSSPNFGLADQVQDPWGGGCVTVSGPAHEKDRAWYASQQMPVIAYSSLARGLFSGKVKSGQPELASEILDEAGRKGYAYPENFERLARCEELAGKKNCSVAQLAMAYIFRSQMNTFAVVGTRNAGRMKENIAALEIPLSEDEIAYLELRRES